MSQESEPLIDKDTVSNWANLRLGHEAMMLDKIQRQNRIVEDTVRGQQKDLGYESTLDQDDEMGVSVGNKITHIHQQEPEKKGSSLIPLAMAAAAGATGLGGLGAAGAAITYALTKDSTQIILNEPAVNPGADPGFGKPVWKDGYENSFEGLVGPDPS